VTIHSAFYQTVTDQLRGSGWALLRINRNHAKYLGPHGKMLTVPVKLDDYRLAKTLLRIAHLPHVSL
jgi:predicted RNA binding protein YcfA (HicA-like mRNA interferase family)